jgi:enoyl-CoA hydratase
MSSSSVTLSVRPDGVAVLLVDQPASRANILTSATWIDLNSAIEYARTLAGVRGLIIASGKPSMFIAGADLKFLSNVAAPNDPAVHTLLLQGLGVLQNLESLPFPTLAAIDGAALGGGFEVALACDYRFCSDSPAIRLGLPEVNLGLIPGWGGTQRLPRLVGRSAALQMITSGQSYAPGELLAITNAAVLQQTSSTQLIDHSAQWLLQQHDWSQWRLQRTGIWHEPVSLPTPEAGAPPVVQAIWRCLELGRNRSLVEGLQVETEEFMKLVGTEQSRQLIQQFFAARKK